MKTKKIFNCLIILLVLFFFIFYIINNASDFIKFLDIAKNNIPLFLLVSLLYFLHLFLIGLILKYTLLPFGIKISPKESTSLSVITNFYNLILPIRGGAFIRAKYLKNKYNFSYSKFLSTLYGLYVIGFFTASLVALVSIFFIYYFYNTPIKGLLYPILVFFIILLTIILISPKISEKKNKYINFIVSILNGWTVLKKNKKAVIVTFLVSLVNIFIFTTMFFLEFKIFNIDFPYTYLILLASVNSLSLLLSITPGSFGVKEGFIIFVLTSLGLSFELSILISLIDRAAVSITILILGPIFTNYLLKRKNEINTKE
jgi:uncharacterized protein (TIRG00374 family)